MLAHRPREFASVEREIGSERQTSPSLRCQLLFFDQAGQVIEDGFFVQGVR